MERLFVYGTLRVGGSAHRLVAPFVVSSQPATVRGRLYGFFDGGGGGYPGLIADPGAGPVRGSLFTLRGDGSAAFEVLDPYEGGDFHRRILTVEGDGGAAVKAWCYLVSPERARAGQPLPPGDAPGF